MVRVIKGFVKTEEGRAMFYYWEEEVEKRKLKVRGTSWQGLEHELSHGCASTDQNRCESK